MCGNQTPNNGLSTNKCFQFNIVITMHCVETFSEVLRCSFLQISGLVAKVFPHVTWRNYAFLESSL